MHAFVITYSIMAIKLIMAIIAAVVFMHLFSASASLKQMTPLSVIINFLLSAILSTFIINKGIDILDFTFVLLIYGAIVSALNWLSFYTDFGRHIFIGVPQVIIQDGKLDTEKMQKLKISARDLAIGMRQHNIHSLNEIEMAQIEPNGDLTIVKKGEKEYSFILIDNGIIDDLALQKIHRTEKWLRRKLREQHIRDIDDIFIAQWYNKKLYVVKKDQDIK